MTHKSPETYSLFTGYSNSLNSYTPKVYKIIIFLDINQLNIKVIN